MIHRSKVYDMNRMAGEIYYQVSQTYYIIFIIIFIIIIYNIYLQPMIQYIESKEYSGFNPRIPSHIALLMTRYLPTVDENFVHCTIVHARSYHYNTLSCMLQYIGRTV